MPYPDFQMRPLSEASVADRQLTNPLWFIHADLVQKEIHQIVGAGRITVGIPFESAAVEMANALRKAGFSSPWFGSKRDWMRRVMFRDARAWSEFYPRVHLSVSGWGDRWWNGAGMWCMRRKSTPMADWPASAWIDVIIDPIVAKLAGVLEHPPTDERPRVGR